MTEWTHGFISLLCQYSSKMTIKVEEVLGPLKERAREGYNAREMPSDVWRCGKGKVRGGVAEWRG